MTDNKIEFPWPIAVMSFQRPDLLRAVLQSLKQQTLAFEETSVCLFQDGVIDPYGEACLGRDQLQKECLDVFIEIFPNGNAYDSNINLGVALNFDRAEKLFFDENKADAALFLEDDLLLSPHYLRVMLNLISHALESPQIAYVAAYGEHRANLEEQIANRRKIVEMRHKWGFGLTRRQWERQKPIIDGYLEIVKKDAYARRDEEAVKSYFNSLGYRTHGSSQDAAKDIASAVLGTTKIMSFACFGQYIGREGLHQTEDDYIIQGYDRTELFPEGVTDFDFPDQLALQRLVEIQRERMKLVSCPHELISAAYRALLRREPDDGGLETYGVLFDSHSPAEAMYQVIVSLIESEEYSNSYSDVRAELGADSMDC